MRESVSFIVIAHHNYLTLPRCLDCVEADAAVGDELILVLNNPDPQTQAVTIERSRWNIYFEEKPGPQHARNAGASKASKRILAFLDADILIPKGWIEVMVQNFSDPWVAIGQSKISQEKAPGFLNWIKRYHYLRFQSKFYLSATYSPKEVGITLDTATMLVRADWFKKVNGFDPKFYRLEDTDFSYRVLCSGGDLFFEDRVTACEITDENETFLIFLKKLYHSRRLLPLFFKTHLMDYRYPFFSNKRAADTNLRKFPGPVIFWEFFTKLVELVAVIRSPYPIELATHYIDIKGNPKKSFFLGKDQGSIRTIWVGGKKRQFDMRTNKLSTDPLT